MCASFARRCKIILVCIAVTGAAIDLKTPVFAGTVSSTDTYAGDVNGLALPEGTFILLNYSRYAHADTFINTPQYVSH